MKRTKKEDLESGQRIPINLLVNDKADGHYLFDFCKVLGTDGIFINTPSPLGAGETIELTFTIPGS